MSSKGTIERLWIGETDRGIKSFWITIKHDCGSTQGFGGYTLDYFDTVTNSRKPLMGIETTLTKEVPKILNRKDWDDLVGTVVDIEGTFNQIKSIGVGGNWVDFEVLFEPYRVFYKL